MKKYGISPTELKRLLSKHKKSPNDVDIINLLALGYYENYKMKTMKGIDEEEYYFKLAYNTKKTVKTIHNYARYLFYEKYDHKMAYKVQKECIKLKPKTQYPYLLYCEALMELKKYKQALDVLLQLQKTFSSRTIDHNLGFCYFKLGDFDTAKKYFLRASKDGDDESRSLFSLALTYYKLGDKDKVYSLVDEIVHSDEFENAFFTHELGFFYYLYGDYQKVKEVTLKSGIDRIDLLNWIELGYSIYCVDEDLFMQFMEKNITQFQSFIDEIENGDSDTDCTEKERKDSIKRYKKEIEKRRYFHDLFLEKPKCDIDKFMIFEYSYCTLFDCKRHDNPSNDN